MKRLTLLVVLVGLSRLYAAPCDAPYYMQGATEYLRTASLGASEQIVSEDAAELDHELTQLTILDTNIVYSVLKGFDGECGVPAQNPVTMWNRPAGSSSSFSEQQVADLYTQMFDSTTTKLGNSGFDWWYAIGPELSNGNVRIDASQFAIGRRGEDDMFSTWFGSAVLIDSTRSGSGLWTVSYQYFNLVTYYDSARLDDNLLATWRAEGWNGDDRRGAYTLQLLRVDYDTTMPAPVRFDKHSRMPVALRVHTGRDAVLFDPLGRMVGSLSKAMKGVRAPGCYLMRSDRDERVLYLNNQVGAR